MDQGAKRTTADRTSCCGHGPSPSGHRCPRGWGDRSVGGPPGPLLPAQGAHGVRGAWCAVAGRLPARSWGRVGEGVRAAPRSCGKPSGDKGSRWPGGHSVTGPQTATAGRVTWGMLGPVGGERVTNATRSPCSGVQSARDSLTNQTRTCCWRNTELQRRCCRARPLGRFPGARGSSSCAERGRAAPTGRGPPAPSFPHGLQARRFAGPGPRACSHGA